MAAGAAMAGRIKTPPARLRVLLASMALTSAFLGIMALVPSVELLFVAYTAMGAACGVLNACFGAIAILRIPESGRGQAMAILGGMTRAVSIGALALGGLLGALLPIRVSFLVTGVAGVLVALAVAAYVLPRFGSEGAADPAAARRRPGAAAAASAVSRLRQAAGSRRGPGSPPRRGDRRGRSRRPSPRPRPAAPRGRR